LKGYSLLFGNLNDKEKKDERKKRKRTIGTLETTRIIFPMK
jgi:hypothetical protein